MSNVSHVRLILIISRVFTNLFLICLCRNREYHGNFQSKTVISKELFCQKSAQVKWEGRPFWSGQKAKIYSLDLFSSLNLLPTYRSNVKYYKNVHHPIPTLPVGTGSTLPIFKINQYINSLFNWVSRYILFLPKLKGKERPFLEGCKKGDHIVILSLGWYK